MHTRFRIARASRFGPLGLAFAIAALTLFASCYPGDQLTVEEADVVVTLFDDTADFASLRSYAMPDSIIHLVDGDAEDTITRDFDDEILAQVVSNMGAVGFTREGDPADADVLLLVAIAVNEQIGYTGYPWGGHWGWYYPYPPGFGWGWYPWYGGGSSIYMYRTGTIFMQMLDPARADSTEAKVPTIWIGALNGIVEGDNIEERIMDGITQAFAQSPYLGEGK
jgi:hypothetical protein